MAAAAPEQRQGYKHISRVGKVVRSPNSSRWTAASTCLLSSVRTAPQGQKGSHRRTGSLTSSPHSRGLGQVSLV